MLGTILLVEDDANDVFFLRSAFSKVGINNGIIVAAHGEEAIDYLQGKRHFSDRGEFPLPSLILLDLKLPHVMGLDVLRWIRAEPAVCSTIVVILTSSDSPPDIASAYDAGANAYLVKPNGAEDLLALASAIRDFWLKVNQPYPAAAPLKIRQAQLASIRNSPVVAIAEKA